MPDRQRTRREPSDAIRIEDVIPADILNDTRVDREYLEQVFRDPQKFLPPRVKPEPEPAQLNPPAQPESRLAKRAKLAGLVAAAALVAVAVGTASTVTGQHRTQPVANARPREITGAAALGGFAVPSPPTSGHSDAKTTKSSTRQAPAPPAPHGEQGSSGADAPLPAPTKTATAKLAPTTVPQKLGVVMNFYKMVGLDPQHALSLLVPALAGDEPGELVRAWASMDSIRLQEAHVQPDGSIIAIVTMLQPDGSRLRITQLLRLAEDASGLISGARLLSTQRM